MKDCFYLNPLEMVRISKVLTGSELKLLLCIIYCLSDTGVKWFVNNAESRDMIAQIGFDKTPERISAILGSLTKKGILKRETNGVYSVMEGLLIIP